MKRTMTSSNGPPGALAMPDWQAGSALTAAKLELEQRYLLQRGRRHLRLVHGCPWLAAADGSSLCVRDMAWGHAATNSC